MALSPDEQAELDQLEGVHARASSGLSPDEQAELDHLEGVHAKAQEAVPYAASAAAGAISGVPFAHQIGAAGKTAMDVLSGTTPVGDALDEYRGERDRLKGDLDETTSANPKTALAAGLASAPVLPIANSAKGLAAYGAASALGNSKADLTKGELGDAATDTATGAGLGLAGYGAGKVLSKVAEPIVSPMAAFLKAKAAKLAGKATGATAAQVLGKLPEDFGEQVLDRGIVGPLDTRADIAKKASAALDASGQAVSDAADQLDAKGASVDRNSVIKYLKDKVAGLSGQESEKARVAALNSKIADIQEQIPSDSASYLADNAADAPPASQVGFKDARKIRGGFDRDAKWDSNTDAATRMANREAANGYRSAEEAAANAADPDLGAAYKKAKTDFHILSPIQEVAEKRAAAEEARHGLNLHSVGNGAVGAVLGGEEGYRHGGLTGGVAGALAGGYLGPRALSTSAVGTKLLSSAIASAPQQFGKYAGVLAAAANRGDSALSTVNDMLMKKDPEYRKIIGDLQGREVAESK